MCGCTCLTNCILRVIIITGSRIIDDYGLVDWLPSFGDGIELPGLCKNNYSKIEILHYCQIILAYCKLIQCIEYSGPRYSPLIWSWQQTNVTIRGGGVIDGQGSNWWSLAAV